VARKRMLTPTIWTNPKFLKLTHFERLLFIGLISFADDEGWHTKDELAIKAEIFPVDNVTTDEIINGLFRLAEVGLIKTYEAAVELPGWHEHQSIKKPQPSRLKLSESIPVPHQFPTSSPPVPPNRIEENRKEERECVRAREDPQPSRLKLSESIPVPHQFPTSSPPVPPNRIEGNGKEGKRVRAREDPPALDFSKFEINHPEIDHEREFEKCMNYYNSRGISIADWPTTYANWLLKPYQKFLKKVESQKPTKLLAIPGEYSKVKTNRVHKCSNCGENSTAISNNGYDEIIGFYCEFCGILDSVEIVKN